MGRVRLWADRRRGSFTVPLELGSRESVKLHQNGRITEFAAHSGGFFSGGNEIWSAAKAAHFFRFSIGIADTLRVMVK